MILYFINSRGTKRFIKYCQSETEAIQEIHKFCSERNFKIYYTRKWETNGNLWYDVGSHTEFFVLADRIVVEIPDETPPEEVAECCELETE